MKYINYTHVRYIFLITLLLATVMFVQANSYSSELNNLIRQSPKSIDDIMHFIDNPPSCLDVNIERAIATGMLCNRNSIKTEQKIMLLMKDSSDLVRIATILPLLSLKLDSLAAIVFKNEIDNRLRLRIAVTLYFLNEREIAKKTAHQILKQKENPITIISWAEWIIKDFKNNSRNINSPDSSSR